MSRGYIYILTNPSFPDYIKIGYAKDVENRLQQLNRSECIPYAFRIYATYEVEEELSDKKVHSIIDTLNPTLRAIEQFNGRTKKREFYQMEAEDAYALLQNIAAISGTRDRLHKISPTGEEIEDEKLAEEVRTEGVERRSPFSFRKCQIPDGAELYYYSNPEIKALVKDERTILFNGTVTSLSASAQMIENLNHSVQGTIYWCYQGETLKDRRNRMEESGDYQ